MSAFVIRETTNKCYSTLLKTRVWIVGGKFFKYKKIYLPAVSQKRQTVLVKFELPHFIETDTGIVGYSHRKQSSFFVKCAAYI